MRRLTRCSCGQSSKMCVLILNRVPVTCVTDPELIRPSIPVMTHSLNQKVMTRKAKARKCTAEIVGNIQAKGVRQYRLVISFSVVPPARSNPRRHTKMCVISTHNSAGMVSIMWCQIVKLSPAPNDIFAQMSSNRSRWTREGKWNSKIVAMKGNLGVRAEPDKSIYHFYL